MCVIYFEVEGKLLFYLSYFRGSIVVYLNLKGALTAVHTFVLQTPNMSTILKNTVYYTAYNNLNKIILKNKFI